MHKYGYLLSQVIQYNFRNFLLTVKLESAKVFTLTIAVTINPHSLSHVIFVEPPSTIHKTIRPKKPNDLCIYIPNNRTVMALRHRVAYQRILLHIHLPHTLFILASAKYSSKTYPYMLIIERRRPRHGGHCKTHWAPKKISRFYDTISMIMPYQELTACSPADRAQDARVPQNKCPRDYTVDGNDLALHNARITIHSYIEIMGNQNGCNFDGIKQRMIMVHICAFGRRVILHHYRYIHIRLFLFFGEVVSFSLSQFPIKCVN